jgi:large subunit ribosomal protein L24
MDKNVKIVKKVNVRVGDEVVVIAGKDKGKKGKIVSVNPETNKCIVGNVNFVIKHKKARSQTQKSERKKQESGIDISNVEILCPKCGKATRVSHAEKEGAKHRVCKKCGEVIDKKYVKIKAKDKAEDKKTEENDKTEKKPLQRREVKHTAESVIKKTSKVAAKINTPRKLGGGE